MEEAQILPILKIRPGEISSYVVVCGDPGRTGIIAKHLENVREVAYNREYRVVNGVYRGTPVTVASHGVGAAGACVCFEELIKAGARVLIRVGTAGSLSRAIVDGDLIVATGAVREDGVTSQLVPLSFPAIADSKVADALYREARDRGARVAKGIVLTVGAFYPGILPLPNAEMSRAGAIGVEMEVSALLIVAALRGARAGAILAVDGVAIDFEADSYNPNRDVVAKAVELEAEIALDAVSRLSRDEGHEDWKDSGW
ncbi:MAG: nucleoside phosphorylase [Firmicutes bacterium]|jgi:uridine phosphorylase|nr:nucleoside phosphorylase [Bacillota bacterium]MDH7496681.1 nucleoside phosphorylase [Bacillota bacterium]